MNLYPRPYQQKLDTEYWKNTSVFGGMNRELENCRKYHEALLNEGILTKQELDLAYCRAIQAIVDDYKKIYQFPLYERVLKSLLVTLCFGLISFGITAIVIYYMDPNTASAQMIASMLFFWRH